MGTKDVHCRSVVRAQGFDDAAVAVFGDIKVSDEALIGLEFTAARHPEHGQVAGEMGSVKVLALKTHASALGPAVVVFYTFNAQEVTFLSIERAEDVDNADV